MIKNLLLLTIIMALFTGCRAITHMVGLDAFYAGNQEDIKAEYLALNQQQKEAYLEFIKDDCLREQEIIEFKPVQSFKEKYFYKGVNNYINADILDGKTGKYWNFGNVKVSKQKTANAVRTCHNLFFEQNNIKHTSKIEK